MSDKIDVIGKKGASLLRDSVPGGSDDTFAGPYLFLSFDLVNSTAYKSQVLTWPEVFESFMEGCSNNLHECIEKEGLELDVREWKRQGDEILFYIPHPDHGSLLRIPSCVFEVLKSVVGSLSDFNRDSVVQLSVKATLWSALVSRKPVPGSRLFNIVTFENGFGPLGKVLDFLGPDVDTGFRISKYASPGKLVIDALLAWYIAQYDSKQNHNISENMRIVSFEDLKGVWNGRRYPIIWYYSNWDSADDVFLYDEEFSSEIVSRIKEKGLDSLKPINNLEKIFKEVNMLAYARNFEASIKEFSGIRVEANSSIKRAELHLVAICKDVENRVLVLKRDPSRLYNPSVWEFGCTFLHFQQNIFDSLKIGYKERYGLSIEIDELSLPVSYYEIRDKAVGLKIPGLIYHAKVSGGSAVMLDKGNYSDYRWVNSETMLEIAQENAVPDFHKRISEYLAEAHLRSQ